MTDSILGRDLAHIPFIDALQLPQFLDEKTCFSSEHNPYLAAWTHGVSLAGTYLFCPDPRTGRKSLSTACPLHPNIRLIQRAIGPKSPAEQIFLASLVSFHSPKEGGRLLSSVGFHGFADFGRLDLKRRAVLSSLLLHLPAPDELRHSATSLATPTAPLASVDELPWHALRQEIEYFEKAADTFLVAWKYGVRLAGSHFFGPCLQPDVTSAHTKWDLCPKVPLITTAIDDLPSAEALFLATLVSFYNAEDGGTLLQWTGFKGLADLGRLDRSRRAVIAGLILNYTGW